MDFPSMTEIKAGGLKLLNTAATYFENRPPVSDRAPNVQEVGPGCSETSISGPERDPIDIVFVGVDDDESSNFVANDTLAQDNDLEIGRPAISSFRVDLGDEPIEEVFYYATVALEISTRNKKNLKLESEGVVLAVRVHETVLVDNPDDPDYNGELRLLEHPDSDYGYVAEKRRYTNEVDPKGMFYTDLTDERTYFAYYDGVPTTVAEYGEYLGESLADMMLYGEVEGEREAYGLVLLDGEMSDASDVANLRVAYYDDGYPIYLSSVEAADLNEVYFIQQPFGENETYADIYQEFIAEQTYVDYLPFTAATLRITRTDSSEVDPIIINPEIFLDVAATGTGVVYLSDEQIDDIESIENIILMLAVQRGDEELHDPSASYEASLSVTLKLSQGEIVEDAGGELAGGCYCSVGRK